MFVLSYRNKAAAWGLALCICAVMTAAADAKPHSIPLPDRKPQRVTAPATQAAQTKGQKVPAPSRKPKRTTSPAPSGPVAKLPQLLEYKIGKSDRFALKSTIQAIYKRRFPAARASMAKIKDKTARKLAQWYYFRRNGNDSDPVRIEQFRRSNPDWPSQRRLQINAEKGLLTAKYEPKVIKDLFAKTKPLTGAGKAALAGAYLAAGNKDKATRLIREAWRKHDFESKIEKLILKRFGKLLTAKDHKARVDRLLLLSRKSKIRAVLRTAALLDKSEQKKIAARIAVVRRLRAAKKLLAAIPEKAMKDDVGFYYSRVQWLRRHKKEEQAWKLLLAAPSEPDAMITLNEWWIERRVNCRNALNAGQAKIAYEIARNHGPLTGNHYYEAEFLAGWIALRFLKQPENAQRHFLALRKAASGPKTTAKAEYWLGRTLAVLKQDAEAKTHFDNAAKYPLTYYGQIARQAIAPEPGALPLDPAPTPSEEDFDNLKKRSAVRTIALIHTIKLDSLAPLFFHQLARTIDSPGQVYLLAKLASLMQQPHSIVRLSKIAFNRGLPLAELAYPTNMMPEYKEINVPVEPALLYALARQESEFNPRAKSRAGARGLMQIMPRTARAIARQHKVRYRRASLTGNPSYNVMLGVAHLGDLLADYNGSYIFTLVAYNAGGKRVRNWSKEFGDPRTKSVDAIDWVERIPFTETRNYVKTILTSVQIFRSRLNGPQGALRIVADLNRGQLAPPAETASRGPTPAALSN